MCTNNTIEGTQWHTLPETGGAPLVADMSSDIASRPIDVKKFGLIFAGAQKNLGPSGATVVIVRKDLAERADKNLPTLLQYRTHIKEKSLYHTPPTFAIYIIGLVMEWIAAEGGISGIEKRNEAKAKLLYDTIDSSSGYYVCPVEKASRSRMNVVFRVAGGDEAKEKKFRQGSRSGGNRRHPGPSLGRRDARFALQRRHPGSRASAGQASCANSSAPTASAAILRPGVRPSSLRTSNRGQDRGGCAFSPKMTSRLSFRLAAGRASVPRAVRSRISDHNRPAFGNRVP